MMYLAPAVLLVGLLACSLTKQSQAAELVVNGATVVNQLLSLATFSDHPNPAVTRILFTPNDMKGRQEDTLGNIFGRWSGSDASEGAVLTGSHCDAIPLAGAYDGTLGVVGAVASLKALKDAGFKPRRSIEVMMFTSEEPTRFGLSCIGSRAMAGVLEASVLDAKLDENGTSFMQAANAVGYGGKDHAEILAAGKVALGRYSHFVELHIEQGPLLEQEGIDIGIVKAIAAPAALEVKFSGDGGHAGALLMPFRNDAGLAAAELALEVERLVLATGSNDTVGTTGIFEVLPNAVNSVPREARLGIDVRDTDGGRRDGVVDGILAATTAIAARRNVRQRLSIINRDPPATCSPEITGAVAAAAKQLGLSSKLMVSRAYHDSLFMARIAPTAMIFVPCRNGWSHRPDEFASESAIANGVSVLALTLAQLSEGSFPEDAKTEL